MADGAGKSGMARATEGRFVIHSNESLADFATQSVQAFAAHNTDDRNQDYVALVTKPGLPPRIDAIRTVQSLSVDGAMTLLAAGATKIGDGDNSGFTLFYNRPAGARLGRHGGAPTKLSEEDALEKVLPPILGALEAWHKNDVGHGAIRPDNLYFEDASGSRAILGDGLAVPAGMGQPASYESMERALADEAGRGEPTPESDMFSLGATVLALFLGVEPGAGKDATAFMHTRLSNGSLSAYTDGHALPERLKELCVGLLEDEPANRWTTADANRWLEGRPNRAMPGRALLTDRRPLVFKGEEYREPIVLAQALTFSPAEGAGMLRGKQITDWLRHIVKDRHLAESLTALQSPDNPSFRGRRLTDEELVARAAMAMHPAGPLRFRGVSVFPNGLGAALAHATLASDSARIERLKGVFQRDLPLAWTENNRKKTKDFDRLRQFYKAIAANLTKEEPGFGIERCLYDLNPAVACQSPLIAKYHVSSLEQVLPALDAVSGGGAAKGDPMDRHLAAFIANRLGISASGDLTNLTPDSAKPQKQRLATLNLLATVHLRSNRPAVKSLANWLSDRMTVVIDDLHNRSLRKTITDRLKKFAADGDLTRMARLLSDKKLRKDDTARFAAAKRDYARIKRRMDDLQNDSSVRRGMVSGMGVQIACYVAYAILLTTIVTVSLIFSG